MANRNSINNIMKSQKGKYTRIQGKGFTIWANNKNDWTNKVMNNNDIYKYYQN